MDPSSLKEYGLTSWLSSGNHGSSIPFLPAAAVRGIESQQADRPGWESSSLFYDQFVWKFSGLSCRIGRWNNFPDTYKQAAPISLSRVRRGRKGRVWPHIFIRQQDPWTQCHGSKYILARTTHTFGFGQNRNTILFGTNTLADLTSTEKSFQDKNEVLTIKKGDFCRSTNNPPKTWLIET